MAQNPLNLFSELIRRLFKPKFSIELNLDRDFARQLKQLGRKYGEEFQLMNGFHNSNLNFSDFIDIFIDTKVVADITIDANANSNTHDVCTLMNDMMKPHTKLLSFNKIYYEVKKFFGKETADKWLEQEWLGGFYMHNASTSSFKPYCFAYDLDQLIQKGIFFVSRFKTHAPQHLTTFNDHVLEFVSWASNRSSGAVGLVSYCVYSWYFWNKDVKEGFYLKNPEYYRRQCFQKFAYDLNQPFLRVTECAFTNISIMDREYLSELFGGRQFPDGEFVIDHIDEILDHQKVLMEVIADTRGQTMQTFPVLTYSLLYQNGKFADEDFARWCNRHNMQWYDSNFYVGSDVTSLSNCCFDGNQKITFKYRGATYIAPFKIAYQTFLGKMIQVFYNGEWKDARLTALKETHPMYRIRADGDRELIATDDHIHLTDEGEKKSYQLKVGMKLKLETYNHSGEKYVAAPEYCTISSIERVAQEGEYVFCVEMSDTKNPYFTLTNGIQTHNCRLISDTSKINAFINSIGGTSLSVGSVQVNTINLRRIALESGKDEEKYLEILKERVDLTLKTLHCVRNIIKRNDEKGLLPNYRYKIVDLEKQYNTIGITAMYEALAEFGYVKRDAFDNLYYTEDGLRFASAILDQINTQKDNWNYGYSLNCEAVPAERANVILCKKDALLYKDNPNKYFIYSNQWIPLMEKCALQEKIRLGAILDKKCGGGQISHINLDTRFQNEEQSWTMLNTIAAAGVIYFAYNTEISVCEYEHAFYGQTCPTCGGPAIDAFTRVVGFLTPISSWSKERRQEYNQRYWFNKSDWISLNMTGILP
jgi:anaerobic ribonucleoside-triphosphate reductase